MDIMKNQRSSFLFLVGAIIVFCAASYFYITQSYALLSIAFAALGFGILLFGLMTKNKSDKINTGLFEWGRAAVFIAVVLFSMAFLVLVNYLSQTVTYRWDVTKYDQHTLTQTSVDFIKGIDAQVELTAFYVGLPPKYLEDLLNEYSRLSNGKISVNIVDPIVDIAYAAKYGNVISGAQRKLIVVSEGKRKDVDFTDKSLNEEQVTNALVRITREQRHAYFLTGHGEFSELDETKQGFSQFAQLLDANNILSDNLMLGAEGKVPEDCDVLIVAGPRSHLTDEENKLIQEYLEQGGDALFLVEAITLTTPDNELTLDQVDKSPSLNSILNHWGVNVGRDVVVDLSSHIGGDQGSPATKNYGNHKSITEGLDYTFYIRPRSITALPERRKTIKLAPIASTATQLKSWAETDRALKVRYDEGIDILGPVPISYVVWEGKSEEESSDTRIVVITDADFLSNAYLNQYSNSAMGINVVNWLVELDYVVFHDQKNIKVERLDLTSKQIRMITVLLLLMPLLIGLIGISVWVRS